LDEIVFEDEADPRLSPVRVDIVVQTSGNLERPAQRRPVVLLRDDASRGQKVFRDGSAAWRRAEFRFPAHRSGAVIHGFAAMLPALRFRQLVDNPKRPAHGRRVNP
jgi:hypothetical protein